MGGKILGIEFLRKSVVGALVETEEGKVVSVKWAKVESDGEPKGALPELKSELKIEAQTPTCAVIPSGRAVVGITPAEVKNQAELVELVELEAEKLSPFSLKDSNVGFEVKDKSLIISVAPKSVVSEIKEALSELDLNLISVVPKPLALGNLILYGIEEKLFPEESFLVIDIAEGWASYTGFVRGKPQVFREISLTDPERALSALKLDLEKSSVFPDESLLAVTSRAGNEKSDFLENLKNLGFKDRKIVKAFELTEEPGESEAEVALGATLFELSR